MKYLMYSIVGLLSIIVFIMGHFRLYDNVYDALGGIYVAVVANFIMSILILGVLVHGIA